jgi:hypothetical protein
MNLRRYGHEIFFFKCSWAKRLVGVAVLGARLPTPYSPCEAVAGRRMGGQLEMLLTGEHQLSLPKKEPPSA